MPVPTRLRRLPRWAPLTRRVRRFLRSRAALQVLKGVLANTLVYVLLFTAVFPRLEHPIVLSGAVLMSVAALPGRSVGACVDQVVRILLGVCLGSIVFIALAHLHAAPVAQAAVLFVDVYVFTLIKSLGLQWFGFALLQIILSFNGAYTAILEREAGRPPFSVVWLREYLLAYALGGACVLVVNLVVFPWSSERELRATIVTALQHCNSLTHLLAKTYTLELDADERKARDALSASIRADYGLITDKLNDSLFEINWSRWTLGQYRSIAASTRALQQDLIQAHSSLTAIQPGDLDLFETHFLPTTRKSFMRMRASSDVIFQEMIAALQTKSYTGPRPPGSDAIERVIDREDNEAQRELYVAESDSPTAPTATAQRSDEPLALSEAAFATVAHRLRAECVDTGSRSPSRAPSRRASIELDKTLWRNYDSERAVPELVERDEAADKSNSAEDTGRAGCHELRSTFERFRVVQLDIIAKLLTSGQLIDPADELHADLPAPSFYETAMNVDPRRVKLGLRPGSTSRPASVHNGQASAPVTDFESVTISLLRVLSFMHALDQLVTVMTELHAALMKPGKPRLQLHFLQTGPLFTHDTPISLAEVRAKLDGDTYTPPKRTLERRLKSLELSFRSPRSLSALKTACAVDVLLILLLAETTRDFFTSYGLNAALIAIVVAMAPTLGQTIYTFIFQILGTGLGAIAGALILLMFRNVAGHAYYAPGIVIMLTLYAIPLLVLLAVKPMFFALVLLAINGAGTIVVVEVTNRDVPGFDSPQLRMAKLITATVIALALAFSFQILILRTPARHTLRRHLGRLVALVASQHELHHRYTGTLASNMSGSPEAIHIASEALKARGAILQRELVLAMPLLKFSAAEYSTRSKFDSKPYLTIVRSCQLLLDRMREGHFALGEEGVPTIVKETFSRALMPYRFMSTRYQTVSLYASATSLLTRRPLPADLPLPSTISRHAHHDALLIAARMAQTPEGLAFVRSAAFMRYLAYLLSITSLGPTLELLNKTCLELYRDDEDIFSSLRV